MLVYQAVVLEHLSGYDSEEDLIDESTIGIYSTEAFAQVGIDWYREQRTKDEGEQVALTEAAGELEYAIHPVQVDTHLIYR